jgi:hypothetical protein
MDKIFISSAYLTIGFMCRQIYKYYNIKQIAHKIKTSIQVDTSFEILSKEFIDKDILIATTITKIIDKNDKEVDFNYIHSNICTESHRGDYFTIKELPRVIVNGDIEIKGGNKIICFEPPVLKSQLIKDENKLYDNVYNSLSMLEKIKFKWVENEHSRVVKYDKGILKDSRVLFYGKVGVNTQECNKFVIKPEYFIGSGLVEFEEMVEDITNNINFGLNRVLFFLVFLTFLHFAYRSFMKLKLKNETNQ